jgi:hypothetical protein
MRSIVAFLFCAFALVSCAKRDAAPALRSERIARVGEALSLDDSTWVVVEAKDLGKNVRPNNDFADPKETSGRFVLVRYKVTNRRKHPESVLDPPKIVDDQSRETERVPNEAMYVPREARTLGIEPLPPNVEREFATLFELPPDARGLKLQVRGLGLLGAKRSVDLAL